MTQQRSLIESVTTKVKIETDTSKTKVDEGFRVMFKKYKKRIILAWILNITETWPYYAAFSVFPLIFVDIYHIKPRMLV